MRRAASSLLIAFAALAGCKAAPAPLTTADKSAAMQADSAWSAAIVANDMAGMTARYAPDAMLMPPDMQTFQGAQQIHQFYQGMSSVKVAIQLTQETADGAGDFMYTTGKYHYQQMPTGPSEDGKYLEVWKRGADGKWMLAAQTWSRNAPPAPMPAAAPAPAKAPARRGAK